jgi:hypothetical protein
VNGAGVVAAACPILEENVPTAQFMQVALVVAPVADE